MSAAVREGFGEALRARIRREGPMPVGDYMAAAIGDYYARRDPFGAGGDFTTAPEISQVFGELIGLWCAVVWRQAGAPTPVRLVELGPGRGTLMLDALRAAAADREFLAAIDLHLVETSPALRRLQRERLAGRPATWHDRFDAVPRSPLIVVANEFLDALPVEQLIRTAAGWSPRLVDIARDGDGLMFRADDRSDASHRVPPELRGAPVGTIFETSPAREAAIRSVAVRIAADGGAALIVDYGHATAAPGETLQAVARHGFANVLHAPGEADLTAHVDFGALASAASAAGARVSGPTPQGEFLAALGLAYRVARLVASAPDGAAAGRIRAGGTRLVDPAGMGLLFKALALSHPGQPAPPGFDRSLPEDIPPP
jgi:NADH dehydrogenase [ubiquinone] 1 alpha subcomplex assembly factor 7